MNSHINRLRAKIETDRSSPSLVLTVWGGLQVRRRQSRWRARNSFAAKLVAALVVPVLLLAALTLVLTFLTTQRHMATSIRA